MNGCLFHRIMGPGLLIMICLITCSQVCHGEIAQQLRPQIVLQGGLSEVTSVCFSRSGAELAAVDVDGQIVLWDLKQQKMIGKFQMPEGSCAEAQLEWDAKGVTLLCWAQEVGAIVIDRRMMKQSTIFSESKGLDSLEFQGDPYRYNTTTILRLSPDGTYLLRGGAAIDTGVDGTALSHLEVIQLETRKTIYIDAPYMISSVALLDNGRFLATDWGPTLFSGNAINGSHETRVLRKLGGKSRDINQKKYKLHWGAFLDVSADRKYAVVGGYFGDFKVEESGEVKNSISGIVDVFQLDPLKKLKTLPITRIELEDKRLTHIPNMIETVCISPDGSYFAAGSVGRIVQIWNRQTMQTVRVIRLENHESAKEIRFAPGKQAICSFTAGNEGSFYLLDLNKNQEFRLSAVQSFDWSADGKQLAVGGRKDGAVLIFNMIN